VQCKRQSAECGIKEILSFHSAFCLLPSAFYLTMTVTSFEPQGVVKVTVYLPVRLLMEVMRKGKVPDSLSVCEKTATSGQSRVVGVTLSAPVKRTVMTPLPPLFLMVIVSASIESEHSADSPCLLPVLDEGAPVVRSRVA
jgi:hypothetical protein